MENKTDTNISDKNGGETLCDEVKSHCCFICNAPASDRETLLAHLLEYHKRYIAEDIAFPVIQTRKLKIQYQYRVYRYVIVYNY